MGAICKTIAVHSEDLQRLLDYGDDKEKTSLDANDLSNLLSYAANPEKTTIMLPQDGEQSMLVSGVLCNPNTAKEEFEQIKNRYRESHPEYLPDFDYLDKQSNQTKHIQKKPVTAIHLIQSFDDENLDPRVAHQIGIELCERLGVQAVVDTHMNTNHFHNHIIINAYMPDCQSKFVMNNTKRIELRRLSDSIQREYGLEISFLDPEQQQKIAKRSLNYDEWKNQREGCSWKDRMRKDISVARDIADDKDEFIEVMKDYGYSMERQKGKDSILWLNADNGKTIWDSTLGKEYMLCNLFPDETPEHELTVETEHTKIPKHHKTLSMVSTSRYDYSGRRRTEIELLIRRAIAIIQKVSKIIHRRMNKKNIKYNTRAKIQMMQEALATMKEFGIENIDDLNAQINLAGKNLSVVKSDVSRVDGEMQFYSTVERVIAEYQDAKTLYDSVKYWAKPHDLHINQFSKRDIALGVAQIAPLSSKQKSELYQMMSKRPNLRLVDAGKGYSNISAIQFRQIKDYFKGTGERPECLADVSDTTASFAYERQYKFLSEKLSYQPTNLQKEKAKRLLSAHGFDDINVDNLTLADIINIENCWEPCPFCSPLITASEQQALQAKLQACGKTINRDVSQIMKSEYDQILAFLGGYLRKQPAVIKQAYPPSDTDLQRTKELALKLGVTPSVDINSMTGQDIRDLYNWMVSQGRDPLCTCKANAATWTQNKDSFHDEISCETPRKQDVLIRLRNATNTLAQLGISPDDIPQMLATIDAVRSDQHDLKDAQSQLSDEYKQLLRLKQQTTYAKDKKFLYASLLDQNDIARIEAEIDEKTNEKETAPDQSEDKKEPERNDKQTSMVDRMVPTKKPFKHMDYDIDI